MGALGITIVIQIASLRLCIFLAILTMQLKSSSAYSPYSINNKDLFKLKMPPEYHV